MAKGGFPVREYRAALSTWIADVRERLAYSAEMTASTVAGPTMTFVDQEITHITHAMTISRHEPGEDGLPVFPAGYWRNRLHGLIDSHHLAQGQLQSVDALLRELERTEAMQRWTARADTAA